MARKPAPAPAPPEAGDSALPIGEFESSPTLPLGDDAMPNRIRAFRARGHLIADLDQALAAV